MRPPCGLRESCRVGRGDRGDARTGYDDRERATIAGGFVLPEVHPTDERICTRPTGGIFVVNSTPSCECFSNTSSPLRVNCVVKSEQTIRASCTRLVREGETASGVAIT